MENIKKQDGFAKVKCGHCGLEKEVLINSISEPVDAFGDFIDVFYADTELQRLEKGIAKLKENNEWGELALSYSLLSSLCRIKAAQLLEEEDNADINEINDWKAKAEKYKRLEKDTIQKLDAEELERGIKTDDETLFSEHEETGGIKKEKKIDDVFSDPGFLEF